MRIAVIAASFCALIVAAAPALAADTAHGKQLYQACRACHGDNDHPATLGPKLAGVVGRKAGSRDDFRYSPAMQRANITWDDANLRDYLLNPQEKVKGNRMPYGGIGNPGDADDVIAYLKTMQ